MKVEDQINEIIEKIRPFLINDGGDVEFVKFENSLCIILVNDSLFVILDFNVSKSVSGVIPEHPNTAPVINAK